MSKKTENREAEAKTEIREASKRKNTDVMYLGPTIPGALKKGPVYKDGVLPERAVDCITEFPAMKILFVEVDDKKLAEAMNNLNKRSALSAIYEQTAKKF